MTPILKCNILQLANNQRFSRICAIFDNQCKIRNQKISYFFFDSRFFFVFQPLLYIYLIAYFVKVFGLLHFSIKKTDFLISDFC